MGKDKVNWDYVRRWMGEVNPLGEPGGVIGINRMYGYPEVTNPFTTMYGDVDIAPEWEIPRKVCISMAITGGFFTKKINPNHPMTPEETTDEAIACIEAGASMIHVHARNEQGYMVLEPELFHKVLDPIRERYPDVLTCGCMAPYGEPDWGNMQQILSDGLLDQTPINTTAVFIGDQAFVKPPHVIIEKTRFCQELGVKPQIAVYTDGDIDNAHRYLMRTGLLEKPYHFLIVPALPGCSPMHTPWAMVDGLMNSVRRIREIDEEAEIMVCATGRASSYVATFALLLGLHIRVGMEDTIWRWPHRDDLIESNVEQFLLFKQMVEMLGREVATVEEYKEIMGIKGVNPHKPA